MERLMKRTMIVTAALLMTWSCSAMEDKEPTAPQVELAAHSDSREAEATETHKRSLEVVDTSGSTDVLGGEATGGQMRIITATVEMEVEDFEEAMKALKAMVKDKGGHVASSSSRKDSIRDDAAVTIPTLPSIISSSRIRRLTGC